MPARDTPRMLLPSFSNWSATALKPISCSATVLFFTLLVYAACAAGDN